MTTTYSLKKATHNGRKRRDKKPYHRHHHCGEGEGKGKGKGRVEVAEEAQADKGKSYGGKLRKFKKYGLLRYDELPEYMKDNEFIIRYYRAEWPLRKAFLSLFQWHNETLNTWTHLLGFVLFVGLTVVNVVPLSQGADLFGIIRPLSFGAAETNLSKQVYVLQEAMSSALLDLNQTIGTGPFSSTSTSTSTGTATTATKTPRWPFYVFLSGSMFCLLASSICHLFSCHSYHLNTLLLRIDYVGITTMIITSFFPPVSYIFQCDPLWQIVYLSTITLFGICTIITLLSPALSSSKCRGFRAMLFCSMGFFGLIPAVHACVVNWGNPKRNITLAYELAMAVSYLTGTGFYVTRVPERFRPGWFDLAGHSHQIFHVFVVMGALAHYAAGLVFLQWRDMVGCDLRG